jgi:N-acetylglucosamine-6-phosphate deacetylase
MKQRLKIYNGKLITPQGLVAGGTVIVDGDRIVSVSKENDDVENAIAINARGKYVSPGFIDIHVHGGGGYDFMDGTETAFLKIAEVHAQFGTTSMLPTTLTSTKEEMLQTLAAYEVRTPE